MPHAPLSFVVCTWTYSILENCKAVGVTSMDIIVLWPLKHLYKWPLPHSSCMQLFLNIWLASNHVRTKVLFAWTWPQHILTACSVRSISLPSPSSPYPYADKPCPTQPPPLSAGEIASIVAGGVTLVAIVSVGTASVILGAFLIRRARKINRVPASKAQVCLYSVNAVNTSRQGTHFIQSCQGF